ncbi:hypothetical protein DOTSEDRAFT_152496, partial [Dothistroma septosporum NZE10]
MIRSCVWRRTACLEQSRAKARPFHQTTGRRDDHGMPDHYATLDIASSASPKDIKKQFYKLSKANHPDLHPDDAHASKRFVKISEAWAVLGSPDKKQRYDRDFFRARQSSEPSNSGNTPQGSHSSSQTGPGGRPASGLSRRRTTFRGPPPSFYRSGGWGEHSAKREEHASKASHTSETSGESASGPQGPGMGPGGFAGGFDGEVPHFNNRAHTATHEELAERARVRRRRAVQYESAEMSGSGGSSVLFNFFMVTGLLGAVAAVSSMVYGGTERRRQNK